MYARHLDKQLKTHFDKYKEVLILIGPRQAGKTTIVKHLFPEAQYITVDLDPIKQTLDKYDILPYRRIIQKNTKTVIIDEVQRLKDPGRAIKIIYDQIPGYQLVVTGSSALNIKNKLSESLAGRKITYQMFPLTLSEFLVQQGLEKDLVYTPLNNIVSQSVPREIVKPYDHKTILDQIMLYGLYPLVINNNLDSKYLFELIDSVVFKDLDEFSLLENKEAAVSLLKLLANQIGSPVNYAELSNKLQIDSKTVKRYIKLFEQSYIVFSLKPYSTKQRDEIGKMPKIYFYDLGLRNALIDNFQPLQTRNDSGALFENFIISELYKYNAYGNFGYHFNFWRTKSGSEIDLVLSHSNGAFVAAEIKYRPRRVNQAFINRYPKAKLLTVTRENYWV